MRSWVRAAVSAAPLMVALGHPTTAAACATCGGGDPTLTVMGAEQPFSGRLRFSLGVRGRWDRLSQTGREQALLVEVRSTLSASYAPDDRVVVSLSVPAVLRDVRYNGGRSQFTTLGLGDISFRARAVLLRDRALGPENMMGPMVGIGLPTSIDQVQADGGAVPVDAQSGTGAITPLLGVFYAHLEDPWSVFVSATLAYPFAGRFHEMPGPSLQSTAALQYRIDRHLTLRGAVDARLDAPSIEGGQLARDSSHLTVFLSPDVLWAPSTDWVLQAGVKVPVAQVSDQGRDEGWYLRLAVTLDVS